MKMRQILRGLPFFIALPEPAGRLRLCGAPGEDSEAGWLRDRFRAEKALRARQRRGSGW